MKIAPLVCGPNPKQVMKLMPPVLRLIIIFNEFASNPLSYPLKQLYF